MLIFAVGGCDWLWPLEGDYDPHRCDPPCSAGLLCHGGQCVRDGDGGLLPDKTKTPKVDGVVKMQDKALVDKAVVESYPWPAKDTGPPCKTGKIECLTAGSIKVCVNSKWQLSNCTAHCQSKGDDYSDGCNKHPFTGEATCNCRKYVSYGGPCSKSSKCVSGYFCGFISSSYVYGFCTKHCKVDTDCGGGPAGTQALCSLTTTTAITICGFVCNKYPYPCPKGLTCLTLKNSCRPPSPF